LSKLQVSGVFFAYYKELKVVSYSGVEKVARGIERCLTLEKESLREVLYLDVSRSLQSTRTSSGVLHSTICL
jgi:hypothetical protein